MAEDYLPKIRRKLGFFSYVAELPASQMVHVEKKARSFAPKHLHCQWREDDDDIDIMAT